MVSFQCDETVLYRLVGRDLVGIGMVILRLQVLYMYHSSSYCTVDMKNLFHSLPRKCADLTLSILLVSCTKGCGFEATDPPL